MRLDHKIFKARIENDLPTTLLITRRGNLAGEFFCKTSFPGDLSEGATPVPIPNTAVKPFSPDGTSRETAWESRTLPGINFEAQDSFLSFSFLR